LTDECVDHFENGIGQTCEIMKLDREIVTISLLNRKY